MSDDQLDLDAIEARAARLGAPDQSDESMHISALALAAKVPALVARVRELEAENKRMADTLADTRPPRLSGAMAMNEIPAPVITPGATPYLICTCLHCGPPYRFTVPEWPDNAWASWLALCPTCGDKRCPGASRHDRHERMADTLADTPPPTQ